MRGISDFPGQMSPSGSGWPRNTGVRHNTWMQPVNQRLIMRSQNLEYVSQWYHSFSNNPQWCNLKIRLEPWLTQPLSYASCRWITIAIEQALRVDISCYRLKSAKLENQATIRQSWIIKQLTKLHISSSTWSNHRQESWNLDQHQQHLQQAYPTPHKW